ncbi:MAG: hypothetical protein LBV33_00350, partial [Lachnospiraceae bacterium]|nr:hypothetical protein [Lachnospiraceae bacterium]
MDQSKFVKTVSRHLECTKAKKREICRDILSDIEVAAQSGSTWSEVEARMGDPVEMAAEFNENMTEAQRQQARRERKRRTIVMAVGIPLAVIVIIIGIVWFRLPRTQEFGSSGLYSTAMMEQQI